MDFGGADNKIPHHGRRIIKPPGDASSFSVAHESHEESKPFRKEQTVLQPVQPVEFISPMHARRRAAEEQTPGKSFDRLFGPEPTQPNYPPLMPAPAPPSPPHRQAPPQPPPGLTGAAMPMSYADALNRANQSNGGAGSRGPPPPAPPMTPNPEEAPNPNRRHNPNMTSTGFNPITGEPMAEGAAAYAAYAQKKGRGPNVQQPPGGHSAGLW